VPSSFVGSNIRRSRRRNMSAYRSTFSATDNSCLAFSVPFLQNVSQKRRRRSLRSKHHTRSVYLLFKPSAAKLMSNLQGCVNAGSCSSLVLYFLMRFRVAWCHILMPCLYTFCSPDSILIQVTARLPALGDHT
jgi:hypothetical protein